MDVHIRSSLRFRRMVHKQRKTFLLLTLLVRTPLLIISISRLGKRELVEFLHTWSKNFDTIRQNSRTITFMCCCPQKYENERDLEGNIPHLDLMNSTKPLCLFCWNASRYRFRDLNSFTHFQLKQSMFHR